MYEVIPPLKNVYNLRNANDIPFIRVNHNYFKNSFFPSSIIEWNKLSLEIRNSHNLNIFKKCLLRIVRPNASSIFNVHNKKGLKFLSRLSVGLSHLQEHKFKHGFLDSLNPICECGDGIETTSHFFLHCQRFYYQRTTLFNEIRNVDSSLILKNDSDLVQILLFGNSNFSICDNTLILNASINFIIKSERFDGPLI